MKKKAFSLTELIVVIVMLGIISSIGSFIVSSMYENYIKTKTINKLQSQTQLALEQIAKRLSYRVKGSVGIIRGGKIFSLSKAKTTDNILTWIGISYESNLGGWSGFIDLNSHKTNPLTNPQTIHSPASNLSFARNIIFSLTKGDLDLNSLNAQHPALILKPPSNVDSNISKYFSHNGDDYTIRVRKMDDETFAILSQDKVPDYQNDGSRDLYEEYYLSHSAYAIIPQGSENDFKLILKYNYQPWEGETYKDGNSAILAEHVSTFRFVQIGSTLRIKICIHDNKQSSDTDFSSCKETAVF